MILGISVPEKAYVRLSKDGQTVLISFDEKTEKYNKFWYAILMMWLTKGFTEEDFETNDLLSRKRIEITKYEKIKCD